MRRAGTGRTAEGRLAWWSVAEGRRGRRWRETVVEGGGIRHSLLLETDPRGRFTHLELSTPAGLLTLHPEGDGTLHGNAIEVAGVRHVGGLPWDAEGVVLLDGSPVSLVAAVHGRVIHRGGGGFDLRALRIDLALSLSLGDELVNPVGDRAWRFEGLGSTIRVDADGLPVLADGTTWPLELGAE